MASFSSTGPTFEGFVKPDVVAPGGHIIGTMTRTQKLGHDHPEAQVGNDHLFSMSGTSQAAAVVSGVVALMLDRKPSLTPNEVKCRLMAAARPALDPERSRAYSIFQQGAGLVNARESAYSTASQCANRGLNLFADLIGHWEKRKLDALEQKYDAQFRMVFDAIRELMAPPAAAGKRRIGFRPEPPDGTPSDRLAR